MKTKKLGRILGFGIGALVILLFISSFVFSSEETYSEPLSKEAAGSVAKKKEVSHIKTPEPLKAVYMTACYAGTPSLRSKLVKLIDDTELNAVAIDIKDYSGTVSFKIRLARCSRSQAVSGACDPKPMLRLEETRFSTIFSKPTNAPPQINSMFCVFIWMNS